MPSRGEGTGHQIQRFFESTVQNVEESATGNDGQITEEEGDEEAQPYACPRLAFASGTRGRFPVIIENERDPADHSEGESLVCGIQGGHRLMRVTDGERRCQ